MTATSGVEVAGQPTDATTEEDHNRAWTRLARHLASPTTLAAVALFAFTFALFVGRPVGHADEAWFLWVAHRANTGSTLYRDVYYVTTPLAMWCMQLAVKVYF